MPKLFNNLLVSSPNGGGVFLVHEGKVFQLDSFSTTGLFCYAQGVVRGLQPAELCIYEELVHSITSAEIPFSDVHDVYYEGGFFYLVGTSGNEILKLTKDGVKIQRWAYPGEDDSRHINCLGTWNGRIIFSAFGDFCKHRGYKGNTRKSGFVQDLLTGEQLITELSQPHSLVQFGKNLLLANSEKMEMLEFSEAGDLLRSKLLDGYTRGICVGNNAIYVGLSRTRNVELNDINCATIVALDPNTLEELGRLHLPTNEVYGIQHLAAQEDLIRAVAAIASTSSARLTTSLAERDAQIADFKQIYARHDEDIANLNMVLKERDMNIAALNEAIAANDKQVVNLNMALEERDMDIAALNEAIAASDKQIVNLNMALEERDMTIAALNEAIAASDKQVVNVNMTLEERDMNIAALNEAIAASDKQIVNLNMALEERDMSIAALNEAIAASDKQIVNLNMALEERDMSIAALNEAIAASDKRGVNLNQTVTQRDSQIENLKDEVVKRGEWALRLDGELQQARALLLKITQGNSWRITLPLREMRRWASTPKQQTRKYMQGGLRTAKRLYQSLPLQHQTKAAHRNTLATYFPKLLLASGVPPETIPSLAMPTTEQIASVQCAPPSTLLHSIEIPSSSNPLVSIIIPVFGQMSFTLRCLASIVANLPQASFEIIVVDDCSPDNSAEVLAAINGIRLIRNKQNCGFIRSCNAGASTAQGEYLHFLNNDTEVTPGWLDELLRTFREFPGTGLAGSKLIYPDGRLQEAGGIIWQDGSAWNFGRFQDPQLPVYNYAREVDYCSGASIMTPKKLFNELGGFDEHYLPAYCEDSDLALKIRDKGYRVIYQPLSTVIHYEGVTSGTDTTQGTKAYQIANSQKLFTRWQHRLEAHQPPGTDANNAKDRRAKYRVLVLDHCTPTPNQDAGSVTVFNLMMLLREMDFQVTFIPEDNFLYLPEYTTALQRAGIEVLYAPYFINVAQHLKEQGQRYNLAFLFRPGVIEHHLKDIRKHCPNAKVLYHTVDLHFLRMSREAELQADKVKQIAADEMKQRELAAIRASDASIVHSTLELELLRPLLPDAKLHVFPLIMDIKGTNKTFDERRDIVFVGGYQHTPNVDAVHYFVSEIMPLIRKQLPGVRFYAVGSKPPADIQALACDDVIITGFVEELTRLLDRMRISVAPLRYGAGIKGKIGTAMAVGLPVVATTLAAEGMSLTDGQNILVTECKEQFINAIVSLYQDDILWNQISKNGLEFASKTWGPEAAWGVLSGILQEINFNPTRGNKDLTLYSHRNSNIEKSIFSSRQNNLTNST